MSDHQKRISSPGHYPVERKEGSYVLKAEGPWSEEEGVPLTIVLRDVLDAVDEASQAKEILSDGNVLVNQKRRSNPRSNVGFMDVITVRPTDEHYRVLLTGGGFVLRDVAEGESQQKLARVEGKTTLNGGVTQLNLDDGNNIETDDDIDTRSSVMVALPDLEIEASVALEEGNLAYVTGGRHTGRVGDIVSTSTQPGSRSNTVTLESDGEEFQTVEDNVFPVGADEPLIEVDTDE